jgi:hypothetical protein
MNQCCKDVSENKAGQYRNDVMSVSGRDNPMMEELHELFVDGFAYCFYLGAYMQLVVNAFDMRTYSVQADTQLCTDHFETVATG